MRRRKIIKQLADLTVGHLSNIHGIAIEWPTRQIRFTHTGTLELQAQRHLPQRYALKD